MLDWVGSAAIITLVVLCIKLSNGVVRRPDCHRAQDSIKEAIFQRFDDLKEFMRNGNRDE